MKFLVLDTETGGIGSDVSLLTVYLGVLDENLNILLNETANIQFRTLEKAYSELKEYIIIAYKERYINEDENFDNICSRLEKTIRLIEGKIWELKQSNFGSYIGVTKIRLDDFPKLNFKDLYDIVIRDE